MQLSALSATLIESELFGHKKGAFTGAAEHRTGWLEVCPPLGTVFLDEIGETEAAVQVKLLRVLRTRTIQRVGDTQDRPFQGKIVAATNRSLAEAMKAGRSIRPPTESTYFIQRAPSLRNKRVVPSEAVATPLNVPDGTVGISQPPVAAFNL